MDLLNKKSRLVAAIVENSGNYLSLEDIVLHVTIEPTTFEKCLRILEALDVDEVSFAQYTKGFMPYKSCEGLTEHLLNQLHEICTYFELPDELNKKVQSCLECIPLRERNRLSATLQIKFDTLCCHKVSWDPRLMDSWLIVGELEVLKEAYNSLSTIDLEMFWENIECEYVAYTRNKECIEWLLTTNEKDEPAGFVSTLKGIEIGALEVGNIVCLEAVLVRCKGRNIHPSMNMHPSMSDIIIRVIAQGNLEYLQWLHKHGYLVGKLNCIGLDDVLGNKTVLPCLQYLHEHKFSLPRVNIRNVELECLKFLYESGYVKSIGYNMQYFIQNDRLDILQYLYSQGYVFNVNTFGKAFMYGRINCVRFLHNSGFKLNEMYFYDAIQCDSVECIQYIQEQGFDIPADLRARAAGYAAFACMKYLDLLGA